MKIVEITDRIEWPKHIGLSGLPRSGDPGKPHVTEIIDRILMDLGREKAGAGGGFDDMPLTAELGFCWEDALEYAFGKRFVEIERPGEIEKDGIVGSPDGVIRRVKLVNEYKLKWQSIKNFKFEDQLKWHLQVKSYCHMLGMVKARFWVCFVMGDWGYGAQRKVGPERKVWDVEFSRIELLNHWKMMKEYRDKILEEKI